MENITFISLIGAAIGTVVYYINRNTLKEQRHENMRPLRPRQPRYMRPRTNKRKCLLCLSYLIDHVQKLGCNHSFHDHCIKKLFHRLNNTRCPWCGVLDTTMECMICLEPLRFNVSKLRCNHLFHTKCIEKWFRQSKSCPLRCHIDI